MNWPRRSSDECYFESLRIRLAILLHGNTYDVAPTIEVSGYGRVRCEILFEIMRHVDVGLCPNSPFDPHCRVSYDLSLRPRLAARGSSSSRSDKPIPAPISGVPKCPTMRQKRVVAPLCAACITVLRSSRTFPGQSSRSSVRSASSEKRKAVGYRCSRKKRAPGELGLPRVR
jgi:hypothetical protein